MSGAGTAQVGVSSSAILVVYGATGDVARRSVLPALFEMARDGLLPERYRIIGSGRGQLTDEEFRSHVRDAIAEFGPSIDDELWQAFSSRLGFAGGGFRADDPGELLDVLKRAADELDDPPQLHYYAVPPSAFGDLTEALGKHGLAA